MNAEEWTALFERAAGVGTAEADVRAALAEVLAAHEENADGGGAVDETDE